MVHNYGTVLLCPQNLAVSGANQVLHNVVAGNLYRGNIILVSPSNGPFASKFHELGVSVRIGKLEDVLEAVRDVRFAICNTIMTAHMVKMLSKRGVPCAWVLHEWWTKEMIPVELGKRNDKNLTVETVDEALKICAATVSVCQKQQELYGPTHGEVIYVGTPDVDPSQFPLLKAALEPTASKDSTAIVTDAVQNSSKPVTFLCIGIVCPRKNQVFTVKCFREMAGERTDVRLLIVGVRRIRDYEINYVKEVEEAAAGDSRIELHDVTHEVEGFYSKADVVVLASLNEVTPMVLAEAMARGKPVLTTGIAGIPEMVKNGVEGYICGEEDSPQCIAHWAGRMTELANDPSLRQRMGEAGVRRYMQQFSLEHMVSQYRQVALKLARPVVLVDMDGVLVDWDRGFLEAWAGRTPVDRTRYEAELCVPSDRKQEAMDLFCAEGFFRGLPAMKGSIAAMKMMVQKGYDVLICTAPMKNSRWSAQEKWEWVREHLGEDWLQRMVLTLDKTTVRGDVLIDDKPSIVGAQQPLWSHIVFDAPYNQNIEMGERHRLQSWDEWECVLLQVLAMPLEEESENESDTMKRESSNISVTAADVAKLRDFARELEGTSYMKDYRNWRRGSHAGAKGEYWQAVADIERIRKQMFLEGDDWSSVHVYRRGYQNWRKGKARGAKLSQATQGAVEPAAFL